MLFLAPWTRISLGGVPVSSGSRTMGVVMPDDEGRLEEEAESGRGDETKSLGDIESLNRLVGLLASNPDLVDIGGELSLRLWERGEATRGED
jgi:hypothetical protein